MYIAPKNYIINACLLFLVFSCSPRHTINASFEKKYGKEIQKINRRRAPPAVAKKDKDKKLDFAPASSQEQEPKADDLYVSHEQYYANVDAVEYGNSKPRETFPDKQVFEQGKNSKALPDNMFRISYYTSTRPPFKRVGHDFDRIKIPKKDSYGIVTAASDKKYVLVGNKSLQHSIDHIKSHRTHEDVRISHVLIKENKNIKRRLKDMKVFGKDIGLEPDEIVVEDKVIEEEMVEEKKTKKEVVEGKVVEEEKPQSEDRVKVKDSLKPVDNDK